MATPSAALLAACRALPKVELHAHLSGSIPGALLARFAREDAAAGLPPVSAADLDLLHDRPGRPQTECFRVFPLIHRLICSRSRLVAATHAALRFFEEDRVAYAELRTTPRALPGLTARGYAETVLDAVAEWPGKLVARVILSLDRARPVADAKATAALAESLLEDHEHAGLLVGVELSGNPSVGRFADFAPILDGIRKRFGDRLPLALHFAELRDDAEAAEMLRFHPDRLGHAVQMGPVTQRALLAQGTPVEVCLTSNLVTNSVPNIGEHPVVKLLDPNGHPFSVCTDDAGVFRVTLSHEYALLKMWVPDVDLREVSLCAVRHSFAPEKVKDEIRKIVEDFKPMRE